MRSASVFVLAAAVGLAATSSPARGDALAPWSYTTTSSTNTFGPSNATVMEVGNHGHTIGSHDITGATFYSVGTSSTPVVLTPTDFTETVWITDRASKQSAPVTFDLTLSGSVSQTGSWLAVTPDGPTTQTVHLGHYYYTVTVEPFQAPADASPYGGRLVFDVQVQHNPEPSSLILAAVGLPLLGIARWRKRLPRSG
jgi:hypothetical protein